MRFILGLSTSLFDLFELHWLARLLTLVEMVFSLLTNAASDLTSKKINPRILPSQSQPQ
jgi:hypothetical protein